MSSTFNQPQGPVFYGINSDVHRQLTRAAALNLDAPSIQAEVPIPPNIVQPPTRIIYPPYIMGYAPGTPIVYLPPAVANPPPIQDQFAITSVHSYQQFSVTDLPPILFRIEPFEDRFADPNNPNEDLPVPMLYDSVTRQPVVNARGDLLRYFSFLPRYISRDVPGCLLEFWFRLDYRLEMNDIRMRMERDGAGKFPLGNALNMRRNRFRVNIKADAWGSSRSWPVKPDIEVLDKLTAQQICLNTVMQVDTVNNRLLKPTFAANNINCNTPQGYLQDYFDPTLPLDYFLANPIDTIPSRKMYARIVLRRRLQNLTMIVQPGPASLSRTAYRLLRVGDDPSWWHDNQIGNANAIDPHGRAIHEIDGLTHRQFMERECGDPTQFAGIFQRNKTRTH